jgi:hypothetical protein
VVLTLSILIKLLEISLGYVYTRDNPTSNTNKGNAHNTPLRIQTLCMQLTTVLRVEGFWTLNIRGILALLSEDCRKKITTLEVLYSLFNSVYYIDEGVSK